MIYYKRVFMAFLLFGLLLSSAAAQTTVKIDDNNRLIVDGKPFYPNGIYMSYWEHSDGEDLDRIADAGFNFIAIYGDAKLKQVQEHGLKGLVPLNNYGNISEDDLAEGFKSWPEHVRYAVNAARGNPSLIGYYINDELNLPENENYRNALCSRYLDIKRLDPNHPCVTVLYGPYSLGEDAYASAHPFKNCTDVMGFDDYAVGKSSRTLKSIYDLTVGYHSLVNNRRPVWVVPQLCRIITGQDTKNKRYAKEVDLKELRLEAYLALIARADGLLWYSYYDLFDNRTSGNLPLSTPKQRWANATVMAKEVQYMSQMLLEGRDLDLSLEGDVLTRGLLYQGSSYILVANPDPTARKTVTLDLGGGRS